MPLGDGLWARTAGSIAIGRPRRFRRAMAVACFPCLLLLSDHPAAADELACYDDLTGSVVECEVSSPSGPGSEDAGPPLAQPASGSEWPPPGLVLITYPTFGVDEDGNACRREITRAVPPGQTGIAVGMTTWYWMEVANLPPELQPTGDCPPGSGPELDAREAQQAMVTLLRQRLPRPQLRIAPGFGLTGMPAYLETGRGLSVASEPLRVELSTGPVNARFRGQGTYTVDWGDGTVTGPHRVVGAPWPDGTVTHTYVDEGSYEVRVNDRWTVTFTVEGLPAQTVGLELTGDRLRFEVRERRSVRTIP
jgi:hypothetical protein